jgi:2-C-methyl-D-erythritol 2,4-cyclodiphosphate synthase
MSMVFRLVSKNMQGNTSSALGISALRIGCGLDVHAFVQGRKLVLGAVEIPHTHGLAGHSDADVLLHAIIDAVLGALAWGDIGRWFPDTDETYRNASSAKLFEQVWDKCLAQGWSLGNCDCVVVTEEPKLSAYISQMCKSIAGLFSASVEQVSVKAKTSEQLGAIGQKEGIAATAVVLLCQK